jgi:hypothetical protein
MVRQQAEGAAMMSGARVRTSHLFLQDASDLKDSAGVSSDLLSPSGANEMLE